MTSFDNNNTTTFTDAILVLGGTGKTGHRIATRLQDKGFSVRIGSRTVSPAFDWNNEAGWDNCLQGIKAIYICYSPDLAIPGATDAIETLVHKAKQNGVHRLVLLSGRENLKHRPVNELFRKATWNGQLFDQAGSSRIFLKVLLPKWFHMGR